MSDTHAAFDQGQVLADVRRALGRSVSVRPEPLAPFVEPSVAVGLEALVARFRAELTAVVGHVYRLMSDDGRLAEELAGVIAEICHSHNLTKLALSGSSLLSQGDLAQQLEARRLSVFAPDERESANHGDLCARLADCGGGVTTVDYAIAETGTLVLSSDERNALLVSLLPAVHIAILRTTQIKASLAEVIELLGNEGMRAANSYRSANFITGPSRTSDVELTLSIGVHGPKELYVIIIDG